MFYTSYRGAGGTGICYDTRDGHPTATVEQNGLWCDPFIYPILDWENNPKIAVGMIFGGFVVFPLLHMFWLGLSWLREFIFEKYYPEHELPKPITSDL